MKLFGNKTESLFDIWSIEHFISGITIGSIICLILVTYKFEDLKGESFSQKSRTDDSYKNFHFTYLILILLISYIWEVFEFYLEAGYTGNPKITYWFQGVEFWLNRSITDPLLVAAGSLFYLKFYSTILSWSARIFSAIWLVFHIFIFPQCMYLQDSIYSFFSKN